MAHHGKDLRGQVTAQQLAGKRWEDPRDTAQHQKHTDKRPTDTEIGSEAGEKSKVDFTLFFLRKLTFCKLELGKEGSQQHVKPQCPSVDLRAGMRVLI